MESSIDFNGKKLISARRASEISGYSRDYIGQLCRAKKISSTLFGRNWFVSLQELSEYKNLIHETPTSNSKLRNKKLNKNILAPKKSEENSEEKLEEKSAEKALTKIALETKPLEIIKSRVPEIIGSLKYEAESKALFPKLERPFEASLLKAVAIKHIDQSLNKSARKRASRFERSVVALSLVAVMGLLLPNHGTLEKALSKSLANTWAKDSVKNELAYLYGPTYRNFTEAAISSKQKARNNLAASIIGFSTFKFASDWVIDIGAKILEPWFEGEGVLVNNSPQPSLITREGAETKASPASAKTVYLPSSDKSYVSYVDAKIAELKNFFLTSPSAPNVNRYYVTQQNDVIADMIGISSGSSSGSGGGTSNVAAITDLNDVSFSSLTYGDLLMYNGTSWVNTATSSLGISGGGGGSSFAWPFTAQSWGVSTSTTLGLSGGFLSTASSTIVGNATTTGSMGLGAIFLNNDYITDLTGTGLTISGGALTVNAVADWTFGSTWGAVNLTPTSTMPIWARGGINASSTSHFNNASTTLLTVDASTYLAVTSGSVGIGTTTPGTKLVVQNDSAADVLLVRGNGGSNIYFNELSGSNYATIGYSASTHNMSIINGDTAGSFILYTGGSEKFRVSDAGDVGIGESLPGSKLSVSGGGSFGSGYDTTAAPTGGLIIEGNVGIGTTTPTNKLTITDSSASQLSLSAGVGLSQWAFRNAGGNFYLSTTTVAGTATTSLAALEISGSGFGTTTVRGLNIIGQATTTTNVGLTFSSGGIDTNYLYGSGLTACNSTSKLIWNSGRFECSTDLTGSGIGGGSWSTTTSAVAGRNINYSNVDSDIIAIGANSTTSAEFWFDPNQQQAYFSGLVGIGTTTPTNKLTITDSSASQLSLSAGVGLSQWAFRNAGGNFYLSTTTVAGTATTSTSALTINGSSGSIYLASGGGGVAIGTTTVGVDTPASLNVMTGIQVNRNGNGSFVHFFQDDVSVGQLRTKATNRLSITNDVGSVEHLAVLTNSGLVGIGTTTPTNKLTITDSSASQLSLSAGVGLSQWAFRNAGGNFYLSTTTVAGTATTSLAALEISGSGFGTTTVRGLNISGQATSTSNVGFNITTGCYAVGGTCIGTGISGLTSYDAWTHPAAGISATTSLIQLFGQASSTLLSSNWLKVGGTASTTIDNLGNITYAGLITGPYSSSTIYSSFVTASTTNLNIGGDSVNDLEGSGLIVSGNALGFDCSDVEGTGINCVGENITLDATGDWTGTFDGQEGSFYLARANHTGTQTVSTISNYDWTFGTTWDSNNLTSSTSIPIWAKAGINASSTSHFNFASTTQISIGSDYVTDFSTGLSISASGAVTVTDITCTDCLNASEIEDIYLFNTGDTATGDYIFDTNTLVIDSTNDRIGIGTTTPTNKLTITDSSAAQLALSDGAGIAQWVQRNAGGNFYLSTTTVAGTATTSLAALEISGSGFGTTTVRGLNIANAQATSTSNVGFNISNGCYAVNGTCISGGGGGGSGASTTLLADSSTFSGTNNFTNKVGLASSTPWGQLSINPNALGSGVPEFVIGSSSVTHFIVTGGGKVGVGTAAPTEALTVSDAGGTYEIGSGKISINSGAATAFLEVFNSSNEGLLISNSSGNTTLTNDGYLAFAPGLAEAMRITTNGYVGIGTTTSNALFALQGTGTTGVDLLRIASSTNATPIITISEWGGITQKISSSTALSIQMASGTPVFQVDTTSSHTNAGIDITAATGQTSNLLNLYSSSNSFLSGFTASGGLFMNISSSTAINLYDGSGNAAFVVSSSAKSVGIGTSTLAYNLNVQGSQASSYIARIDNSATDTTADGLLITLGVANASRTTSNYFIGFADGTQTVAGKIQGGASAVAYTTTAADLAEYFRSSDLNDRPRPGEIVTLDKSKEKSVLVANASDNIEEPLGVISTSPGFIGNAPICLVGDQDCDNNYSKYNSLVAIAGQVPVRISNENGPIKVGDYLTLSSTTPGLATKLVGEGYVIGVAVSEATTTNFTILAPAGTSSTTPSTTEQAETVIVFIKSGWREASGVATEGGVPKKWTSLLSYLNNIGLEIGQNFIKITNLITDKLVAKKVETEELCIDGVCVNKDQLQALVEMSGVNTIQETMPQSEAINETDTATTTSSTIELPASTTPTIIPIPPVSTSTPPDVDEEEVEQIELIEEPSNLSS